jgi:RNA polymerase sigma-70 factor (ECF subfamily)
MSPDLEALLAGSGQVRKLARNLVADATLADDLSQDAWVAALQGRPADGVPRLRWMGAVLRNLLRQEKRSAARRRHREELAAQPESTPPPSESLERLEAHRVVVDAVAGLHEPYRTAIVQRYFDGLSPREIAAKGGVPVRTVHTQLSRALGLLRTRLEHTHGAGFSAWLPLLLSLGGAPGGFLGTATGALLMDAKGKLVAGALALVGLFVVTTPLWRAAEPESVEAASVSDDPVRLVAPEASDPEPVHAPESGAERVAAAPAQVASEPEPEAAATMFIDGRVLNVDGQPVAGLAVFHRVGTGAPGETVLSAADGTFQLPLDGDHAHGHIECADENWTPVLEPTLWNHGFVGEDDRNVLIVAPALPLAGTVVDEAGEPVAGAEIVVTLPWGLRSRFPIVLESSKVRSWVTKTDVSGQFALDTALVPEGFLRASFRGLEHDIRSLPEGPTYDLELVLKEPGEDQPHVRGTVVDQAGFGVENARVALAFFHTRTGPDGTFAIPVSEQLNHGVLSALKEGHQPAFLERVGDSNTAEGAWPDPIVLQLGGPPLAIGGRVLDANGDPVPGVEVRLVDETHFGPIEIEGDHHMTIAGYVEPMLRGATAGGTSGHMGDDRVVTGDDGRFRIEGLIDRSYTLSIFESKTMAYSEEGPIAAGREHVELYFSADLLHPRVAGRILSLSGEPVSHVGVMPIIKPFSEDPHQFIKPVYGTSTSTNAEGEFAFTDLSAGVTRFNVSGMKIGFGHSFEITEGDDLEALEFRVPMRCHMQVDLNKSALEADQFSLLDEDGEALDMNVFRGDFAYSSAQVGLTDGRSEVVSAAETARTLVLYQGGEEVVRVPVRLDPSELNLIEP